MEVGVLMVTLVGCMAAVHVETSIPGAEIGLISQTARPSEEALSARYRGEGSIKAKVPFSVFETWWAWVKADGYETTIVKLPQSPAALPTMSCAGGLVVPPLLAGCLFVSRPKRGTTYVELTALPEEPVLALPEVQGEGDERPPPPTAIIRPRTD